MNFQRNIISSFIAAVSLFTLTVSAQNQEQVTIKIDANVNGKSIVIDTTIDNMNDFDIHQYLQDLGLGDEIAELNININDGPPAPPPPFEMDIDDSSFEEMKMQMQHFECPPIPEMPPMPGTANMMFFNGNKSFLGVVSEKTKGGVIITEVVENSAAKEAGLLMGDVITKINEMTVESTNNLVEIIGDFEPGTAINVTYIRDGKTQTANATLKENTNYFESAEWEEYGKQWEDWGKEFEMQWNDSTMGMATEKAFLGVHLGEADNGVLIEGTEAGSAAEEAGLMKGDIITALDGISVNNYNAILEIIEAKNPGDNIEITYLRNGKKNTVSTNLKSRKSEIFMWKGDEDSMHPFPMHPAPPCGVHTYTYCMGDSTGKNVNMQIKVIKQSMKEADEKIADDAKNPEILDPETIQFYPNPNNGTFTLKFNLKQNGDTQITIKDIQGATVYNEDLKGFEGSYEKVISLGNNAKGNYLINVTQNGFSATKQIVVQ